MGYLSHKKKEERIDSFLSLTLVLTIFYTLFVFFEMGGRFGEHLRLWHFQYYLGMQLLFLYALYTRRWIKSVLFLFIIFINFIGLSATSNIFLNTAAEGQTKLNLLYQKQVKDITSTIKSAYRSEADVLALNSEEGFSTIYDDNYRPYHEEIDYGSSLILSDLPPEQAGKVSFSPTREASYMVVSKDGQKIMILNINFSDLKHGEAKTIYKNLEEFILAQNVPIVIVGDFGQPAWMPEFQHLMRSTGLEVKNKVILSNGTQKFNILALPTINVLGYKALGVDEIAHLEKSPSGSYPFLFSLRL